MGENEEISKQDSDYGLIGIKGWLLLVVIAVLATPFIGLYTFSTIFSGYLVLIDNGYAGLAYFEIIGNSSLILISAYSAFLLIQRRTSAKNFLIYAYFLGNIIFLLVDSLMANYLVTDMVSTGFLTAEDGISISGDYTQLSRAIFSALI